MEIKIYNFTLSPNVSAIGTFDLLEEVTREKKETKEQCQDQSIIGYGMKLESCVNKIIHKKVIDKLGTTTLKGFVCEYKVCQDEIKQLLGNI